MSLLVYPFFSFALTMVGGIYFFYIFEKHL